mmetsp:Transcript_15892/g.48054  ORF Transcript_15892/g.48054 Transcript_15892/m.48054 type:complete len:311 (+) Transcript_15892:58-990(+)
MPVYAAAPRVSNAVGDLVLGVGHVYALRCLGRRRKEETTKPETQTPRKSTRDVMMRWFVTAYFVTLLCFQWMGAWFHIVSPGGPDLPSDASWLAYLTFGCLAPCLYGAALSWDVLRSRSAVASWLLFGVLYAFLAAARIDLADRWDWLPRSISVPLPPLFVRGMASMTWMPSALRANGTTSATKDGPLTLTFDGRGYARTPFDAVFDDAYASQRDLVAAFPSWRTDSLTLLMLCFGVLANAAHLLICLAKKKNPPPRAPQPRRARRHVPRLVDHARRHAPRRRPRRHRLDALLRRPRHVPPGQILPRSFG